MASQPIPLKQPDLNKSTIQRKFKAPKRLTLPLFSIAHTKILMLEFLSEFYEGDMEIGATGDKASKPTLAKVLNLDTNEQGLLIANSIIVSTLEQVAGGYLNKCFRIQDAGTREGKRYRDILIDLMEEEK